MRPGTVQDHLVSVSWWTPTSGGPCALFGCSSTRVCETRGGQVVGRAQIEVGANSERSARNQAARRAVQYTPQRVPGTEEDTRWRWSY